MFSWYLNVHPYYPYYQLPYCLLYNTTDLVVNEKPTTLSLYYYNFRPDPNLARMVTMPSNICNITTMSRNIAKQYDQEEEETHKVTSPNTPIMVSKIPVIYVVLF